METKEPILVYRMHSIKVEDIQELLKVVFQYMSNVTYGYRFQLPAPKVVFTPDITSSYTPATENGGVEILLDVTRLTDSEIEPIKERIKNLSVYMDGYLRHSRGY